MPSPIRLKKIANRIKEDLSELLIYEVEDPRLSGVMVTDVNVDRELYYANIYVSALEGKVRSKEVLAGLESASGFLRSQLAQGIELRTFPRLRFYWDPTPENADRIEFLLKQLHEEEAAKAAAAGNTVQETEQTTPTDNTEEE
ncbi:MAG: 30S ribosome-binding factor RbfA [Anaerolineaceae bacterium]|nr:30S ribosome-binding factor RbfA [Anaerolineaceae bacterium]